MEKNEFWKNHPAFTKPPISRFRQKCFVFDSSRMRHSHVSKGGNSLNNCLPDQGLFLVECNYCWASLFSYCWTSLSFFFIPTIFSIIPCCKDTILSKTTTYMAYNSCGISLFPGTNNKDVITYSNAMWSSIVKHLFHRFMPKLY